MMARISGRAVDQGLNSASSAVFSVGLVAATDDATLGALAIQMTALPLLLGLARTSVYEGVLFRATAGERSGLAWLPVTTGVVGGAIAFVISVAAGRVLDLSWELSLATALVTFAVLSFDGLRFAAFALGDTRRAIVADTVWLSASILSIVVLAIADDLGPSELSLCYAAAGGAGALALLPVARGLPRSPMPRAVRREFRFGLDFLLQVLPGQLTLLMASLVTSLAAVGVLRAAVTVFSPLATIVYAIRLSLIERTAAGTRKLSATTLAYAAPCIAYGITILAAFALIPQVTSDLLGSLPLIVLALVAVGEIGRHVSQAAVDHARAFGRVRPVFLLRTVQAVALVAASFVLAALADDVGLGIARAAAFTLPVPVALVVVGRTGAAADARHGTPILKRNRAASYERDATK